jgi:RNA polymerase sigma factor (sigma-70 family)
MSPRISIRLLATQSDQRLVALARDGHERAFETLVHRYRRPLLRYARRMRLSEARAEDVLQQSFMQSWIALSGGAEVREVRSWLYRIVHNVAVNAMRGPAEAHGELTQAVQDRAGLVGVSNIERAIAMRDALTDVAALPRLQRQAIFLTAVDGQSHEQVAGTLGITPGALRGLLYRARSTLRSAAAALTPPPLLAWASAGAGSAGPSAERLAELAGGGGAAAGMAGLFLKGAVVAVTAGAVATGASVLSAHHHSAGARAAHGHVVQATSAGAAGSAGSLELAPGTQLGYTRWAGSTSAYERSRHGRDAGPHRGEHGSRGASRDAHRHGGGSTSGRAGDRVPDGGHDLLASEGRGGRLSSRAAGRDGSDGRGSGEIDARSGQRQDSGSVGGGDGFTRDGSGRGGSEERSFAGSDGSAGSLRESSGSAPDSTSATTGQPSEAQQLSTAGATGEGVAVAGDARSGKNGSDG